MVDMWSGCTDDVEESSYKTGALIDKIKGW